MNRVYFACDQAKDLMSLDCRDPFVNNVALLIKELNGCAMDLGSVCHVYGGNVGRLHVGVGNDQTVFAVVRNYSRQTVVRAPGYGNDDLVRSRVVDDAGYSVIDLDDGIFVSSLGFKGNISKGGKRSQLRCNCRIACRHRRARGHCFQNEGKSLCFVPIGKILGNFNCSVNGNCHRCVNKVHVDSSDCCISILNHYARSLC